MTNIFDKHLPPLPTQSETPSDAPRSNKRRPIAGLSTNEQRKGIIELADMSALAFETLEDAMRNAEYPVAVQAAKMVLDRSGFGPSSTIKIDDVGDLSNLSNDELAALALKLAGVVSPSNPDNKSESNASPSTPVVH